MSFKVKRTAEKDAKEFEKAHARTEKFERIAERRGRIQKKTSEKAKKRDKKKSVQDAKKNNQNWIENEDYLKNAKTLICNLYLAGHEYVSQHLIEVKQNEALRRKQVKDLEVEYLKQKQEEKDTFDSTISKWTTADTINSSDGMLQFMSSLKEDCVAILKGKTNILNELRRRFLSKERDFERAVRRNCMEVDEVGRKMDEVITGLSLVLSMELSKYQTILDEKESAKKEELRGTFNQLMISQKEFSTDQTSKMAENKSFHDRELHRQQMQGFEDFSSLKIKLEGFLHDLKEKLKETTSVFAFNHDKLNLNCEILDKKAEEGKIMQAENKRLITHLNAEANVLIQKCSKFDAENKMHNKKLNDQFLYETKQIDEIKNRTLQFQKLSQKQFEEVWLVQEEDIKELAHKVLSADKLIHEQILGLSWTSPDLNFFKNVGPIVYEKKTKKRKREEECELSEQYLKENVLEKYIEDDTFAEEMEQELENDQLSVLFIEAKVCPWKNPLFGKIVNYVSEVIGFLIEEKSLRLFNALENDERALMAVNAIFQAIEIETYDDYEELEIILVKYSTLKNGKYEIKTHNILLGFMEFLNCFKVVDLKPPDPLTLICNFNTRNNRFDDIYWHQYADLISKSRITLWEIVLDALTKYYTILKLRARALEQEDKLIKENCYLEKLINVYRMKKGRS